MKKQLLLIIIGFLLIACSDGPNSLGNDTLEQDFPGDLISLKEFDSHTIELNQIFDSYIGDTTFNFSAAERVLLGKFEDVTIQALLKFNINPTNETITKFKEEKVVIEDVYVKLLMDYMLESKDKIVDFTSHRIRDNWNSVNFTYDSLKILNYDNQSISNNIKVDTNSITFKLDNLTVREWLEDNLTNVEKYNYGVLLKPTQNFNTVVGFLGLSPGIDQGSAQINIVIKNIADSKLDTLRYNAALDVFVMDKKSFNKDEEKIIVQGVTPVYSNYKFSIDQLPQKIAINKAELSFTYDELKSKLNVLDADQIRLTLFADSTQTKLNRMYSALLKKKDGKVIGDFTWILQYLINNPSKNYGFKLSLMEDDISISRFVLYSNKENDKSKQPKLKIYYTQK